MQLRDLTMVFSSFASMAAGVFLPGLAGPLEAMPRLMLMVMLYLSFLAVGAGALWDELRAMPGIVCRLTVLRLLALPLFVFAVFRLIMPEFSLGALLLGAALTAAVILLCALCYYHLTPAGHLPPEPWGGLPLGWIGGNHA